MWRGDKGGLKVLSEDVVKKHVKVQHKNTQVCFSNCQDTLMGDYRIPACLLDSVCHFLKLQATVFHGSRIFSAV